MHMMNRIGIGRVSVLLPILAVFWLAGPAQAGGVIYVDADANPGGNGANWATAFADLQDALAVAAIDLDLEAAGLDAAEAARRVFVERGAVLGEQMAGELGAGTDQLRRDAVAVDDVAINQWTAG